MYLHENTIHFDEEDQCNTCQHNFDSSCPYLQALYYGIVSLVDETVVNKCELYKSKITHLKRIK